MKIKGRVVWFDRIKGIGFIKPEQGDKDYFVHYTGIDAEGFRKLEPNDEVEFEEGRNNKGVIAINVKTI